MLQARTEKSCLELVKSVAWNKTDIWKIKPRSDRTRIEHFAPLEMCGSSPTLHICNDTTSTFFSVTNGMGCFSSAETGEMVRATGKIGNKIHGSFEKDWDVDLSSNY